MTTDFKTLLEKRRHAEALKCLGNYDFETEAGWAKLNDCKAAHASLEPILLMAIEALQDNVENCPYGCMDGDCGAEWEMEPMPCAACKNSRETLESIRKELEPK